jgi:transposase-like protein
MIDTKPITAQEMIDYLDSRLAGIRPRAIALHHNLSDQRAVSIRKKLRKILDPNFYDLLTTDRATQISTEKREQMVRDIHRSCRSKPRRKVKRYSSRMKQEILRYRETHGIMRTAERYSVSTSAIYKWLHDSPVRKQRWQQEPISDNTLEVPTLDEAVHTVNTEQDILTLLRKCVGQVAGLVSENQQLKDQLRDMESTTHELDNLLKETA